MEDKTTKKETPTNITKEQKLLAELSPTEARNLIGVYTAITGAKVNECVSQQIGKLLSGSEKALFTMGTVVGSNDVIIRLKTILNNGSNSK